MAGVNVKMGVSGLSEFKKGIDTAKRQLKTMDAQLELTEKQFKATGDQEAYMKAKTELLNAKLEEQKIIVQNAEKALKNMKKNGVTPADKAFQSMQTQLLNAQSAMIDTKMELQGIGAAGADAEKNVGNMGDQLKEVNNNISLENVNKALDRITNGMEAAAKKAIKLGKYILNGTMDAAKQADELITRSVKSGIGVEELQAMDYAAAYVDTDVDTIIAARKRLQKAMGSKDKETADVFTALGIDPKNTSWEDAFWKAGEALKNWGDEVEQNNYATKLFGKSYDDLFPLFDTGREKYEQLKSEQTVLTEAQVKALGAEDDAMKKMEQQIDLLQKQFWAGLAPAITDTTNALSGLVEQFNIYLQSEKGQQMLEAMGNVVSGLFSDLSKIDPEETIKGVIGVLDDITSALQWVADNKDGVVTGVKAFVGAWAVLETAKGVTTALQLINGIKSLGSAVGAEAAGAAFGSSWGAGFASAVLKAAPWLAGLALLAENAFTPQGNDDLIVNGQLTEAAKKAGYDLNGNGELITPNRKYEYEIEALKPGSEWNTTGEAIDKTQLRLRNAMVGLPDLDKATSNMERIAQEIAGGTDAQRQSSSEMIQAAGTLEGMPGLVEAAIVRGMSNIKIFIDGATAGKVLSPYVGAQMGGIVAALSK